MASSSRFRLRSHPWRSWPARPRWIKGFVIGLIAIVLASCALPDPAGAPTPTPTAVPVAPERAVTLLPLRGPLTEPEAELSGLAWFNDVLVLLPQYPHKWRNSLFGLHRADIAAVLAGTAHVLDPFPISLSSSPPLRQLEGYEGLEAIAFDGNRVFLAVEARMRGYMQGYLLEGTIEEKDGSLHIELDRFTVLAPQTRWMNKAYETLFVWQDRIIALYEVNGADVNPDRAAVVHDGNLQLQSPWSVPVVEYRLTDATRPDAQGRFWAVNFYWPGDKRLMPAVDEVRDQWGEGPSHARTDIVERILALQIQDGRIVLADTPPIEIELLDEVVARNWEGIALWDEHGFLLAADQFPTTLLAYVPR